MARRNTFDGLTFDPLQDGVRLSTALERVYELMRDGQWRTLQTIARMCHVSEAGASARLRDFRKERFQHQFPNEAVNSQRVASGLWQYQLVVPRRRRRRAE
jgi:hypothetical protein